MAPLSRRDPDTWHYYGPSLHFVASLAICVALYEKYGYVKTVAADVVFLLQIFNDFHLMWV